MAIVLRLGPVEVDLNERRVRTAAGDQPLSALEVSLLAFLAANRGITVSRERLLAEVWGYSARVATRAVDNTVSRLRKKLEADPTEPRWLVSTRGGGYRLEDDPPEVLGNLPADPDAFVGRERELAELTALVEAGARLVTVVGVGGIGKTRFALRHAAGFRSHGLRSAWWCDLSEARDLDGVVTAVARALAVPLDAQPVEQLGLAIAGRGRCVVLLDNFEQVRRHAAETLGRWMALAPDARFLVTSRERLGMRGEHLLDLPPLEPEDAALLFVRRAEAARRGSAPPDREAIRDLVALLEHLPLAIELAAARTNLMTPRMLLDRMGDRFRVLVSDQGRIDRQATLTATLDWSWELLGDEEQRASTQLALFEGGFDLTAAEQVLLLRTLWPVDAVQSLLDKSFVRRTDEDRLDMLVTVQEYMLGRLDAAERRQIEARHGRYFAGLDPDEVRTADLDNLVAACRRAIASGEGRVAARTAAAAWAVREWIGPFASGIALLEAVLAMPALDPLALAVAHGSLGDAHRLAGNVDAADEHLAVALALSRELEDPRLRARILGTLALLRMQQGRMAEARAHYELALSIHRARGDRRAEAELLGDLGLLDAQEARMDDARVHYEGALALHRAVGNRRSEGLVLGNLGQLHLVQGRVDEARASLEGALAIHAAVGNVRSQGAAHATLGSLHRTQGRMDEARAQYEAALRVHRSVGNVRSEAMNIGNLGTLSGEIGRPEEARGWFGRALHLARQVGDRRSEAVALGNLGIAERDLDRLDDARHHLEQALALSRELNHPRLEGQVLAWLGDVHRRLGDPDAAWTCVIAGESLLRSVGHRQVLGTVVCIRAELLHDAGDRRGAEAAVEEAEALRVALGAGPESALGRRVDEVRRRLDG